jgi:hypothetical protein
MNPFHQRSAKRRPDSWRKVVPGDFKDNRRELSPEMIGTVFSRTFVITAEDPDGSGRRLLIEGKSGRFAFLAKNLPSNIASAIEWTELRCLTFLNWEGVAWALIGNDPGSFENLTGWTEANGATVFEVVTRAELKASGYQLEFWVGDVVEGYFECKVEKIFSIDQIVGARLRMLALLEVEAFRIGLAARYKGRPLTVKDLTSSLVEIGIPASGVAAIERFSQEMAKQNPEKN